MLRIGPRMAKECRKAGREVISMEDIPFPAGTHVSMAFEATKNDPSIHPSMHRQSMRNAHQPVITLKLGYKWTNQLLWVGMMMVMVQV